MCCLPEPIPNLNTWAPAGLRGKRGLTEHVHGCLHCPPPDLPTACIMLAAKKCEKLSVFCHPAIASCNTYCTAQSTQIRPAVHGRRTVKKTCHARVWRCNTFLAVRCKRFNCISGKKEHNKKYRQDTAENGRINVQKFINLHWSQSVISCQKH